MKKPEDMWNNILLTFRIIKQKWKIFFQSRYGRRHFWPPLVYASKKPGINPIPPRTSCPLWKIFDSYLNNGTMSSPPSQAAPKKYLNNGGYCLEDENIPTLRNTVSHIFSFETSKEKLNLTDIQSFGKILRDPEIASAEFHAKEKALFCVGNLCRKVIKRFSLTHKCNNYCQIAGLNPFGLWGHCLFTGWFFYVNTLIDS